MRTVFRVNDKSKYIALLLKMESTTRKRPAPSSPTHSSTDPSANTATPNPKRQKCTELICVFEDAANKRALYIDERKTNKYHNHFDFTLKSLDDLLFLDRYYTTKYDKRKTSNINFFNIHRLAPAIRKLQAMVGLEDVKEQMLAIIVFFLQRLDVKNQDMLHTVVYGGPGVGKTRFIGILGEIYAGLGVLEHGKVTFVKRSDLIGQYLGHTAVKTRKVIEEAKGGVLVIDEAYSLGDTEQRDSFSRECIDTLNQYLSEAKQDFVCVIAGYKHDLETRFFKTNPGLERRFAFRFSIPDYSPKQLRSIFMRIVEEHGWTVSDDVANCDLFDKHRDLFQFNGGDMETLFTKIKFFHSMRVFSLSKEEKKVISLEDLEKGMETFTNSDRVKNEQREREMIRHLYM